MKDKLCEYLKNKSQSRLELWSMSPVQGHNLYCGELGVVLPPDFTVSVSFSRLVSSRLFSCQTTDERGELKKVLIRLSE